MWYLEDDFNETETADNCYTKTNADVCAGVAGNAFTERFKEIWDLHVDW